MPRYLATSRVSKPVAQSSNHRLPSSQSLLSARRTKPNSQLKAVVKALDQDASDDDDNDEADQLLEVIKTVPVFNVAAVQDVPSVMQYVAKTMFSNLPDRAGMNSVRIAEVLNFQKKLPPIVSIAHVHAIISASSKTEREIQGLLTNGTMLKLRVTGRGNDVTGLSEVLILLSDYRQMLHASELPEETVTTFVDLLTRNPRSTSMSSRDLSASVSTSLITAGFLVSSSLLGSRNLSLSGSSVTGVPVISRAVSGTTAAVGGEAAFERLGGVGSSLRRTNSAPCDTATEFVLSVPNIGVYLRLLDAGRQHLLHLLRMSKHRQAPLYLLRERWDGAVDSDSSVSQAKRLRGEFSQILPAKTKKWKKLSGLNFDWALEECLGAGMIELFETHAVGLGVRALV